MNQEVEEMKKLVTNDPTAIRYCTNSSFNSASTIEEREQYLYTIYDIACQHGLVIEFDLFYQYPELCQNEAFLKYAMDKDKANSFFVQFYEGSDISVYIKAISCGYIMDPFEIKKFSNDLDSMRELVSVYPEAVFSFDNTVNDERVIEIYQLAYQKGLSFNEEVLEEYPDLAYNDTFMTFCIDKDINYAQYYKGDNFSVLKKAVLAGYLPTNMQMYTFSSCDELFLILVDKYSDLKRFLLDYKGDNPLIFKKAIEKGYRITRGDIINHRGHSEIYRLFILEDPSLIQYYSGTDVSVYLDIIERNPSYIMPYYTLERFLNDEEAMKSLINKDRVYAAFYQGIDRDEVLKESHLPSSFPTEGIRFYKGNLHLLVDHYQDVMNFLKECDISEEDFIQYLLGIEEDWLSAILTICESSEQKQEFIRFKNLYYKYQNSTEAIHKIHLFMKVLFFYDAYPELCSNLVSKDELTDKDILEIKWLYGQSKYLEGDLKPKSLEDFKILHNNLKTSYQRHLNYNDINSIKDTICKMLFNEDVESLNTKLSIYGHTIDFKLLKFNDRSSLHMKELSEEIITYTSMIEKILDCDDIDVLRRILLELLDNYDLVVESSILFQDFEDKIRNVYETEILEMSTNIKDVVEQSIDKEKTKRYGVEVLDFSDKQYILLAHVKSEKESIKELVNGESSPEHNFISLSAISYRNQNYYGSSNRIIFGYDYIPKHSFICSSIRNMGTDSLVEANNMNIQSPISRVQRGLLETSSGIKGFNSELLCFRDGVRPSCLILPNGREATEEEIRIAKEYGLKFVVTQDVDKLIRKPKPLYYHNRQTMEESVTDEIARLSSLKEKLLSISSKKARRRIAVFSDAHALFEPTLAILEDIRRKGITEIYSLGDNIGTGPNPREVLELLDEYHVKSLMGNHEAYNVEGLNPYREHLSVGGAYSEAIRNVEYTTSQLTEEQIHNIRCMPKVIELTLGGEKLLLCHYGRDYNSGEYIINPDDYSMVLQGHVHFREEKGNIRTLQGAGIGGTGGEAYYLILTEKEEGGFDVEVCTIPFNLDNLKHDINMSELPDIDTRKIDKWAKTGLK